MSGAVVHWGRAQGHMSQVWPFVWPKVGGAFKITVSFSLVFGKKIALKFVRLTVGLGM